MIAKLIDANKVYDSPAGKVTALDKSSIEIYEGELLLIIGPSGSGKTTLLSLLGCLIVPTEGKLFIEGVDVSKLSAKAMARIRLNTIGFVFQQFNLLAPLNAYDNVAFPLKMLGVKGKELGNRVNRALDMVNMTAHARKLPKQLSGGEQQRIAIARALITNPKMILCDEPTASLDVASLNIVMEELHALARSGKSVCVVTHDQRLHTYADRSVKVENGKVFPIE